MDKMTSIYDGYKSGVVNPMIVYQSMIKLSTEESSYANQAVELMDDVNSLKRKIESIEAMRDEVIDRAMILNYDDIPDKMRKNKELTAAYLKYNYCGSRWTDLTTQLEKLRDEYVIKKSQLEGVKLLINTVHNSIEAGRDVLSYLKHEQSNSRYQV